MLRSAHDFDTVYPDSDTPENTSTPAGPEKSSPSSSQPAPGAPDPALVAEAQAVLAAAERAEADADADRTAAADALADAEGAVSVLEMKVDDVAGDDKVKPWRVAEARLQHEKAKRAFARAGQRFIRAEVAAENAETVTIRAADALAEALETPAPEPDPAPVLRFASLPVFVEEFVLPNCVHRLGEQHAGRWCVRWWEHAEAVTRLEASWEAFEVMRREPAPSFSTWLRDHFDVHMRALTAVEGVFHRCDAEKHFHEVKSVWASEPPPPGMFPVDETATYQPKRAHPSEEEEGTR